LPKDGKKAAVVLGAGVGIAGLIYLATRARAAPPPPPPPPGLANLYGKVTDAITGKPLAGVLITLNGYSVFTGSDGRYEFTNLEPGGYTVEFSKEGYLTEVF